MKACAEQVNVTVTVMHAKQHGHGHVYGSRNKLLVLKALNEFAHGTHSGVLADLPYC